MQYILICSFSLPNSFQIPATWLPTHLQIFSFSLWSFKNKQKITKMKTNRAAIKQKNTKVKSTKSHKEPWVCVGKGPTWSMVDILSDTLLKKYQFSRYQLKIASWLQDGHIVHFPASQNYIWLESLLVLWLLP